MLFYIPQLVQTTRWDDLGFTSEFIRKISNRSKLVAHQLLWNMEVNMYRDEDGTDKVRCCFIYLVTDYGCPMKPFFIEIPNFWAWADKFWGIWGVFE